MADKTLTINDKEITLTDLGRTEGGRNRLKAQVYVSGIGQVFLTAYNVEKEIGPTAPRRGRPPGSKNKATTATAQLLDLVGKLNERLAAVETAASAAKK